jgi:hypothetical protein
MNDNLQVLAERIRREVNPPPAMRPRRQKSRTEPARIPNCLTLEEAAAEMRVSLPTFRTWNVPRFKQGRIVLIRRKDLDAFVASRIVTHDADGK